MEWVAYAVAPDGVLVGYEDTIGDLAAHGAGGIVAGFAMLRWVDAGGGTRRDETNQS